MDTFFRFLYEFLEQFFNSFILMFKGLINGIINMFNIKEYVSIINFLCFSLLVVAILSAFVAIIVTGKL